MSSIEPCLLLPGLRMIKTTIFHEKCISLYEITAFQNLWFRHFPVAAERRLNKFYLFFWSNRGYQARFITVKL